ncbi:hypothetical protein EUGRSUZ_A01054 [Eucalyptus grandis]|uniref:Uncharacterized protein n=2 Tax=Eucalyptus grandis TaxID=71139 RepID=A0ACC3M4H9_EUCGR|nr:hypothetical protein EUGRSUZ_A01054 [Eucalyptus grandis]
MAAASLLYPNSGAARSCYTFKTCISKQSSTAHHNAATMNLQSPQLSHPTSMLLTYKKKIDRLQRKIQYPKEIPKT